MKPNRCFPLRKPFLVGALTLILLPATGSVSAQGIKLANETRTVAAPATSKCDPYKNYDCLNDYLGNNFWQRLTNYYQLEIGQAGAPADPKAPPARRENWPPAAQPTPPMPFTEWPYGASTAIGATRPGSLSREPRWP